MEQVKYVAGFLFSPGFEHVVLIEKNKPEWQKGLYNGIGGKIEAGETPVQAMAREFNEEAGLHITHWEQFCKIEGEGYSVDFFFAQSDFYDEVYPVTDEVVEIINTDLKTPNLIDNLRWLIPLAIDKAKKYSGEITVNP